MCLELVVLADEDDEIEITNKKVLDRLQNNLAIYDKQGEMHYDIISAFIKSIRGSDPDAAVYWLARMIEGGEDVKFIARRLLILSAEDVGLANPNALLLAQSTFDAVHKIGYPEARIILSECVIYLATSPKSNSAYSAIDDAIALGKTNGRFTGSTAHSQCTNQIDERNWVRKKLQIFACFRRQFCRTGLSAGKN